MTRYVVLIAYPDTSEWDDADEATRQSYMDGHAAFSAYVAEHGREISAAPLADAATATTLRRTGGVEVLTDGPFAETAEQIGGYYDVDLPDLDHALTAARLLPAGYTIEIRPAIAVP